MTDAKNDKQTEVGVNVTFSYPEDAALPESGFNRHGVKEHEDGSIDVIFKAMEPGTWKGIEITESFLRDVAQTSGEKVPIQMNHSFDQMDNVGWTKEVKFSDGFLRVKFHVPNTGSEVRSNVIADFTHDPPAITDGSVGFDPSTLKVERTDDGEPRFKKADFIEFSLTPFPSGYDNGGITPQFSEDGQFSIVREGPDEGDIVQWQVVPELFGMVEYNPEETNTVMVSLHEMDGGELVDTGNTITAGVDDLVPFDKDTEGSQFSKSQLKTLKSQLTIKQ